MGDKDFQLDDLVWAKMKGYPPWPAKISQPPADKTPKAKKAHHYVFFYGTHDHAWILDDLITPHSDEMLDNSKNYKKKPGTLLKAIEEIEEASDNYKRIIYNKRPAALPKVGDDVRETPDKPVPKRKKVSKVIKESSLDQSSQPEDTPSTSQKAVPKPKLASEKKSAKKRPLASTSNDSEKASSPVKKRRLSFEDVDEVVSRADEVVSKDSSEERNRIMPSIKLETEDIKSCLLFAAPSTSNVAVIPPYKDTVPAPATYSGEHLINYEKWQPPTPKVIGLVGLGMIGSQLVKNLLVTLHDVVVWNRTLEKCDKFKGARKAESAAQLVRMSDMIFCCVASPADAKEVVFSKGGILEGFDSTKSYVEMTTMDIDTAVKISEAICGKGGRYLEAPFVGSRQDIENGVASIFTAGEKGLFMDCSSVFSAFSRDAYYFGNRAGMGFSMSLLINMVKTTTFTALAETMALAKRCEIDSGLLMNAIEHSTLNCPAVLNKAKAMDNNDSTVDSPIKYHQHILQLALSLSGQYSQPLGLTSQAHEVLIKAMPSCAEEDISILLRSYLDSKH